VGLELFLFVFTVVLAKKAKSFLKFFGWLNFPFPGPLAREQAFVRL
jgi:hypothetical protein